MSAAGPLAWQALPEQGCGCDVRHALVESDDGSAPREVQAVRVRGVGAWRLSVAPGLLPKGHRTDFDSLGELSHYAEKHLNV